MYGEILPNEEKQTKTKIMLFVSVCQKLIFFYLFKLRKHFFTMLHWFLQNYVLKSVLIICL